MAYQGNEGAYLDKTPCAKIGFLDWVTICMQPFLRNLFRMMVFCPMEEYTAPANHPLRLLMKKSPFWPLRQ